jgi:hypothetical protein
MVICHLCISVIKDTGNENWLFNLQKIVPRKFFFFWLLDLMGKLLP